MKHTPTPTMLRVLEDAAKRKGGFICPMRNVWAAAETAVLQGLRRRGLATDECSPRVTDEGRAILTRDEAWRRTNAAAWDMVTKRCEI